MKYSGLISLIFFPSRGNYSLQANNDFCGTFLFHLKNKERKTKTIKQIKTSSHLKACSQIPD